MQSTALPPAQDTRPFLEVAAGIVHRPVAGAPGHWEVLMGQRPQGKAYAGWWEFPGGKIEAGETVSQALCRELEEELDLQALSTRPWVVREHSYPHARVRLHFHRIFDWRGTPRSMEAQAFAWQALDRIVLSPLLPAAWPLLEMLRWPARLGLVGFAGEITDLTSLDVALARACAQGFERVLLSLSGALAKPSPEALTGLGEALRQAAGEGLQVCPSETLARALEQAGPDGAGQSYWRQGQDAGAALVEVWGRGSLFEAASVSDEDDLARSARPQAQAAAWTLQARVLLAAGIAPGAPDPVTLSAQASVPLYWPDEPLLALGGHGLALAV